MLLTLFYFTTLYNLYCLLSCWPVEGFFIATPVALELITALPLLVSLVPQIILLEGWSLLKGLLFVVIHKQ